MSKRLKKILPICAVLLAVLICIVWIIIQKSTMKNGRYADIRISGVSAARLDLDNETKKQFHDTHYRQLKSGRLNSLYNDDCIYSPGITVFKSDTELPKLLPENEWYNVDVITCAAPNLNSRYDNIRISDKDLKELHKKRAKRILDIAVSQGEDVIILGAFGCGAFRNPPDVVAQAYREVIDDYKYDFKTIEFAVYCPPQQGSSNYHAFQRAFR